MTARSNGRKLLAEWFWTDRWMESSAFLLPIAPRGLYREMLTQAWRRGARLPSDHEAIRRAVGCTTQEWNRYWPRVRGYWRVDGDSLVNDTQLEAYGEVLAATGRASQRGARGARGRRSRKIADQRLPDAIPGDAVDAEAARLLRELSAEVGPRMVVA